MIVPTYNERGNVDELLKRIFDACQGAGIDVEILIVDDNSPDGTASRAEELAAQYPVRTIRRAGKLGLSSAVTEGYASAMGEILVVMDADLSHPPEKIPEMVSLIRSGKAKMVIGSRYVKGGGAENWPFYRKLVSKGATFLSRGLTKVKDPMSGFFAVKREVVEGVELNPVGYKIGLEVIVKGKHDGMVSEVPILFANRKAGSSKLGGSEMLKYIDHVSMLYEHRHFWLGKYLKFAFIGGIGALINLAVLWLAHEVFFVYYLWAATIAFVVADTNNYIWNRLWTFKSKAKIQFQYFQFLVVSVVGLLLNLSLLWLMVDNALPAMGVEMDKASLLLLASQVVAIFVVSLFNFGVNSLWTFRKDTRRLQ
ncbi:MAG TPA: glycosyltransferase family 2 protein [Thermoplasmata archaeon]|nr:glycosyltransferase family 2 protein [Thermoplasmata archaeon]